MAKNDMHVIVYKILTYIYECNRAGKPVMLEDICHDCRLFKIPESYWLYIMSEIRRSGFVDGILIISCSDGTKEVELADDAHITISGAEYLQNNSCMQKAAELLGRAFDIAVSSIIAAV